MNMPHVVCKGTRNSLRLMRLYSGLYEPGMGYESHYKIYIYTYVCVCIQLYIKFLMVSSNELVTSTLSKFLVRMLIDISNITL